MERLGWWLCVGLALLGLPGVLGATTAPTAPAGGRNADPAAPDARSPVARSPEAETLHESHITYPLEVDGWHAVGEHRFEDQAHGVCVRFAHGQDQDRWIDLYFYPAGALSHAQFIAAAREEAELIRQAHLQAGHEAFEMGPLQPFAPAPGNALLPAQALDLAYAVDGTSYSSAMTLLLDRMHFIKARFSIRNDHLSRRDAREQLQAFTAHLQRRVGIVAVDGRHGAAAAMARPAVVGGAMHATGMREIRLDYGAGGLADTRAPNVATSQTSAG